MGIDEIDKEVDEGEENDSSSLEKFREKIKKLREEDPNIYPMN